MADLKISQLTGATTPLVGTEIVPVVQSGTTKNVSVDNLTTGKTVPANGMVFPATQKDHCAQAWQWQRHLYKKE